MPPPPTDSQTPGAVPGMPSTPHPTPFADRGKRDAEVVGELCGTEEFTDTRRQAVADDFGTEPSVSTLDARLVRRDRPSSGEKLHAQPSRRVGLDAPCGWVMIRTRSHTALEGPNYEIGGVIEASGARGTERRARQRHARSGMTGSMV